VKPCDNLKVKNALADTCTTSRSAQFAVVFQSGKCTVFSVVSVSTRHSFSHEISTFCLSFLSVALFGLLKQIPLYTSERHASMLLLLRRPTSTSVTLCAFENMRNPATAEKSRRERQICENVELVRGKVGLLIEKRRLFYILIIENS
jgi:hypothetical protein